MTIAAVKEAIKKFKEFKGNQLQIFFKGCSTPLSVAQESLKCALVWNDGTLTFEDESGTIMYIDTISIDTIYINLKRETL